MAGRPRRTTTIPQAAPVTRPATITKAAPPATPSGPAIVVAAMTAPRLTIAPIARLTPPASMSIACAIETSTSGSQLCENFATPLTLMRPGKR